MNQKTGTRYHLEYDDPFNHSQRWRYRTHTLLADSETDLHERLAAFVRERAVLIGEEIRFPRLRIILARVSEGAHRQVPVPWKLLEGVRVSVLAHAALSLAA